MKKPGRLKPRLQSLLRDVSVLYSPRLSGIRFNVKGQEYNIFEEAIGDIHHPFSGSGRLIPDFRQENRKVLFYFQTRVGTKKLLYRGAFGGRTRDRHSKEFGKF